MILVDTNILMYERGYKHPNKEPSVQFLRRVAAGEVEATIDAEDLQEIIHRYRALKRWADGKEIYSLAVSARDAVHAAVVLHYKFEGICTFDSDFDHIPGCRRVGILI